MDVYWWLHVHVYCMYRHWFRLWSSDRKGTAGQTSAHLQEHDAHPFWPKRSINDQYFKVLLHKSLLSFMSSLFGSLLLVSFSHKNGSEDNLCSYNYLAWMYSLLDLCSLLFTHCCCSSITLWAAGDGYIHAHEAQQLPYRCEILCVIITACVNFCLTFDIYLANCHISTMPFLYRTESSSNISLVRRLSPPFMHDWMYDLYVFSFSLHPSVCSRHHCCHQ